MTHLTTLITLCKFGLDIRINNHRVSYQLVNEYLSELPSEPTIEAWIVGMMNIEDTIIEIQAFPHNSNNSITVYHYDIDKAIDEMITILT